MVVYVAHHEKPKRSDLYPAIQQSKVRCRTPYLETRLELVSHDNEGWRQGSKERISMKPLIIEKRRQSLSLDEVSWSIIIHNNNFTCSCCYILVVCHNDHPEREESLVQYTSISIYVPNSKSFAFIVSGFLLRPKMFLVVLQSYSFESLILHKQRQQ